MHAKNVDKLNELNLDFYRDVAESFDSSRQYSWKGWDELAGIFEAKQSVLDLGCGNGRFYSHMVNISPEMTYVGIDSSKNLLNVARSEYPHVDFYEMDLLDLGDMTETLKGRSFNLIVLFGVMHHIPGMANRKALIDWCRGMLEPGGRIVITVWDFMEHERFRSKIVPWTAVDIDEEELEQGDYLLDWKRGDRGLRYCHYMDTDEAKSLFEGLEIENMFKSDGKSGDVNRYYVLKH